MAAPWAHRYAQRTKSAKSSIIRELLKLTQRPEVISFGGGLPAPEVFPVARFQEACQHVLSTQAFAALQYGPTEGYPPLRELIVAQMARYGILATVDNVLITKLLINRGDRILVESPTYLGALQAFDLMGAEYVTVPIDDHGLQTSEMERALRSGPKFMYILPNFQNPGGVTLSRSRRDELVLLSDKYGIPIIEDDPYGQLRYEGEHIPPLVVLDRTNLQRDNGYHLGNVIYLSTYSKAMAPGLRLGWIVAPPDVITHLVQLKQSADLHTSTFIQMVAYEVARDGFLDEHVKLIRRIYSERRDAMLEALHNYFPPEVSWTHPKGGLFLWVTLPPGIDTMKLLDTALRQDVAFVPGDPFYPGGDTGSHMRLNFSNAPPEQIREGIRRLSIAVAHELEHSMAGARREGQHGLVKGGPEASCVSSSIGQQRKMR